MTLSHPLINGAEHKADNLINATVVDLGGGEHVLKIYAANNLGDCSVMNKTITLPYASSTPSPTPTTHNSKKSHGKSPLLQ